MKVARITLLATMLAASAGITAQAQDRAHGHGGKHPHRMHMVHFGGEAPLARLVKKLELTDEQRQSLEALLESSETGRKDLHERQRANFEASLTTLPDDPGYPAMIEARKQLALESIQQRSDLNVQIYALLTPEQKAQVPALIEEMKAKVKEHRAIRKGRRGDAQE